MAGKRKYPWDKLVVGNAIPVPRLPTETLEKTYSRVKAAWMMYRYQNRAKGMSFVDCDFTADPDLDKVFVTLKVEGRGSVTVRKARARKLGKVKKATSPSREIAPEAFPAI